MPFQNDEPEQLNIIEELKKMESNKTRAPRAPILNPHHLVRAFTECEGDFYKVLAWLSSHYNYAYKPQQVKNAYMRLNKELAERGYEPLKFAPARKNKEYLDRFAAEWAGKGVLKKAEAQKPAATKEAAKKPSGAKAY